MISILIKQEFDNIYIMSGTEIPMIKFKRTQGNQQTIELAFEGNRSLEEYANDLADLFDANLTDIKLVFKGKILNFKSTAQNAKLQSATVMVVINSTKKQPKKILTSKEQAVPGAGMSTGLGSSSPFGVGGYQAVNHPQYMSAISSAVDPDKMQEMMDDPQYQGMMEQMLQDPDTLRQLMEENPMMKQMVNNNPMMKQMLSNPAMLKMIFNKETIKKTKEYIKNGGSVQQLQNNAMAANFSQGFNPFTGGFQQPFPQIPSNSPNVPVNPFINSYGFGRMPPSVNPLQAHLDQMAYKHQLRELQLMGFKDKAKNIRILKEVNGDVDSAIQKLCSE